MTKENFIELISRNTHKMYGSDVKRLHKKCKKKLLFVNFENLLIKFFFYSSISFKLQSLGL